MTTLARVKSYPLSEQNPILYSGVDHTNRDKMRNENFTCDFCEMNLTASCYHQTESGLLLCKSCFVYMAALLPSANENVERFLLGNVV